MGGEIVGPDSGAVCDTFLRMQARYRRQWRIWAAGCAGAAAGGAVLGGAEWGLGLTGLAAIVLWSVSNVFSRKLTGYYKNRIVPRFVASGCEEGRYEPTEGIDERTFVASDLFGLPPDRYRTEDLVEGRVGKTAFRFAEVHAQERRTVRTRRGTHTVWVDIFRGLFFVADFNKHFHGQTTLVPNFWGAKWLAGRQRVQLEHPRLMKVFLVCSTDQIEARYILSPGLMERIMGLWDRYPGKLSISFTGSCIMVARSCGKNHYEAGLWRSLSRCIERDAAMVRELTAIVEELDMNTRIWTKE